MSAARLAAVRATAARGRDVPMSAVRLAAARATNPGEAIG
jgi:hypothetical protein